MKIEFIEEVTVYPFPDGKPVFAKAGEIRDDFPERYAAMLVRKGHAREVAAEKPAAALAAAAAKAPAPASASAIPAAVPAAEPAAGAIPARK